MFNDTYDGKIDTWANQFLYNLINKYLTINPSLNLVKNIGFGRMQLTKGNDIFTYKNMYYFPFDPPKLCIYK